MSRSKSTLYKSFTAAPFTIYREEKDSKSINLVEVDRDEALSQIADDVLFITECVSETIDQWETQILDHYSHYRYEKEQKWLLEQVSKGKDTEKITYNFNVQPNTIGRELRYVIQGGDLDRYLGSAKTGRSRYSMIYQDRLFREVSSWYERVQASNKTTDKYVSQGWSRTVRSFAPQKISPKISLSASDAQFVSFINDGLDGNALVMRMVVKGVWHQLHFALDHNRFSDASKVCLPDITLNERGTPRFHFAAEYDYTYGNVSDRYLVGVDVGITTYATVVVWDTKDECIVHASMLSQDVHSLHNSIKASDKQKIDLVNQGRYEEAQLHRQANITKKKELAIKAAQEIADIAFVWDNAVIVTEDLSWISNTMQNGRWNRGELLRWIKHYAELNGSRMFKVNSAKSSQECHVCRGKVSHPKWKDSMCPEHGLMDRDVNAAAVIAQRFTDSLKKVVSTRRKSRKYENTTKRRSPKNKGRRYPGCKNNSKKRIHRSQRSTPKHHIFHQLMTQEEMRNALEKKEVNDKVCSLYHNDDGTVCRDETSYDVLRTLKKQHDFTHNELYSLL